MTKRQVALICATFVALFYAINFSSAKEVTPEHIGPFGLTWYRVVFTCAIFWIISIFAGPKEKVPFKELPLIALAGKEQLLSKETILQYKHGTRPKRDLSDKEISDFKNQLLPMIETASKDYESGSFTDFKEYTTSTGYELTSIEDSISLVNIHEGIHLGYSMALRKAVL